MLDQFVDYLYARRRSPNTIRLRLVYLRQLAGRHPDLATVTLSDLEAIIAEHRHDWKPETVNAAISSWRVFYRWAFRRRMIDEDPTEYLETAYVPRVVKVVADDGRIRTALTTASLETFAMLLLGREGGLRRSEIATLRTEHREEWWLRVTGKGQRVRMISIGGEPDADGIQHGGPLSAALDALETLHGPGYYFQGEDDGHIAPDTVYRRVRNAIGTGTHSLRRGAITAVYEGSGGDIRLAQEFAGHADPKTTAGYVNVEAGKLVSAGGFASIA